MTKDNISRKISNMDSAILYSLFGDANKLDLYKSKIINNKQTLYEFMNVAFSVLFSCLDSNKKLDKLDKTNSTYCDGKLDLSKFDDGDTKIHLNTEDYNYIVLILNHTFLNDYIGMAYKDDENKKGLIKRGVSSLKNKLIGIS